MCSRTNCRSCGKPTWTGCGSHIEQALAGVAKSARCACDKNAKPSNVSSGFLGRLFSNK